MKSICIKREHQTKSRTSYQNKLQIHHRPKSETHIIIKSLEEKTGEHLHDLGLSSDFLGMTPTKKKKIDKLDF